MVGNDVIDLDDPETFSGACHARFDARVFTVEERAALAGSGAPARLRWALWAAKEAAYKAAKQRHRSTVFSPARFAVRLTGDTRARVTHGDQCWPVALEIGARHVHAIATARGAAPAKVVAGVERMAAGDGTCPGIAARALAVARIAPLLGLVPSELCVVRDGRIPRLQHAGADLAAALSLSHHGRLIAFACALPSDTVWGMR
jgi:phosphopantetheinyl transferase (holo-ACP synthase)